MIIAKDIKLKKIESLIREIYSSQNLRSSIRLPANLKYGGVFGLEPSMMQLVSTWAFTLSNPVLHLYSPPGLTSKYLQNLISKPYGLAAALLCSRIVSSDHKKISRSEILALASPLIESMYIGDLKRTAGSRGAKPTTINLISVTGATKEYIRPFYKAGTYPELQDPSIFRKVIFDALKMLLKDADFKTIVDGINVISEFIRELVVNTDEHARTDIAGNQYIRGCRGLSIKHKLIDPKKIEEYGEGNQDFIRYLLRRNIQEVRVGADISLLEISVFDTGPGLSRKLIAKETGNCKSQWSEVDLDVEIDLTKKCFESYVSTKNEKASGLGLSDFIKVLPSYNGFFRLRTGRVCFFQEFDEKIGEVPFAPKNWFGDKKLSPVVGTVFTVCIPIIRK